MIFNNNHNDKKIKKKISALVGTSFSWIERFKRKGIGSTRIKVIHTSAGLKDYFGRDQDIKYINIELRPKGILVYIKNKVNDYVWVIPFYKLSLYQSKHYSIHADGEFLKCDLSTIYPRNEKFFRKIHEKKSQLANEFPT